LDLDGAGLDVEGQQGQVATVALDSRPHELDELVEVGRTLASFLVGELGHASSLP
jgi:hypothetical protein